MKNKYILQFAVVLLILTHLTACGGSQKEKLKWVQSLKAGMTIEQVKKSQPSFVNVEWNNGTKDFENSVKYKTNVVVRSKKKKNLSYTYSLRFRDGKFDRNMVDLKVTGGRKRRKKTSK
jgi:major membrane immunogen (membrane-anchored lipoprotein)